MSDEGKIPPNPAPKPPKRRLLLLKVILILLLAPWLLLFLFLIEERIRGKVSLARYKRDLIAKGEKLSPADFVSKVPEGENGAPKIREAVKSLTTGPTNPAPTMKVTLAGSAVVYFREDEWRDGTDTNNWDRVAEELEPNRPILDKIRAALQNPVLDNKVDLAKGAKTPLPHLVSGRKLARWFGAQAQLALHDGNLHAAADSLITQIQVPRLYARDHIMISELVRVAMAAIARNYTWEALHADGWTEEDLVRVQRAWENEGFGATLVPSLEGERVYIDCSYPLFRKSNPDVFESLTWLEALPPEDTEHSFWERSKDTVIRFFRKQVYCRAWRYVWLEQDERHSLENMQRLIEIARLAVTQKSFAAVSPAIVRFQAGCTNRNLYDRLRYPLVESSTVLWRVIRSSLHAETERSVVICAIALKRHSFRYGKPPASLDALVPEFLASVPTDYMDSKPIKYHLNADGGFTLYSVGDDGKDDGGDSSLPPGNTRIQDLWSRKDFVWPAPASPEEVQAYRSGKEH